MCVYMHSRFVVNHLIQILKDGPLISEVVLSQVPLGSVDILVHSRPEVAPYFCGSVGGKPGSYGRMMPMRSSPRVWVAVPSPILTRSMVWPRLTSTGCNPCFRLSRDCCKGD
jgi:hypothetical protein